MTESEFNAIYARYARLVHLVCSSNYRTAPDLEGLKQSVWLQVWKKRDQLRATDAHQLQGWIGKVATTTAIMARRADYSAMRDRRVVEELDVPLPNCDKPRDVPVAGHEDRIVARVSVDALMGQIAPGYRRVLQTRLIEGRDCEEAAQALHCTVGNVKSQTHKGIKMLQKAAGVR